MPKNLVLSAVLLLHLSVFSQSKDVPAFGKIDKADLQSTSCSFDKDAVAEVLADVGQFEMSIINGSLVPTLRRFKRIKILNDDGLDYANIKIPYADFGKDELISNLVANTYNLDETGNIVITKLDKNLIYNKNIDPRHSQKVFTMPNVKVGSIIEYKYTVNDAHLRTWYLQTHIPVQYSHFSVDVPSFIDIYLKPSCTLPYESRDESKFEHNVKTFTMRNVPALEDEPFMTCDDDYLQKIDTWAIAYTIDGMRHQLLRSWTEKTKDMLDYEYFGMQLKKSIPRTSDLDASLQKLSDPYQKMITIYNYVRDNMAWDGYENLFASSGVKAAWKEKKGTSGEINLILINLLKDAGLNVHPVMLSTHDNGLVNSAYPDFYQFNKVMALVEISDKKYVLDGTNKYTPAGLIPEDVLNTEGLVIDESNINKYWWTVLSDSASAVKDVVVVQAEIKNDNEMEGNAMIKSQDYSRIDREKVLKQSREKFLSRYCLAFPEGIKVDSLKLEDENTDSLPLIQKFNFHAPVSQSGDYSYFSADLFLGLQRNPFISDNRSSDIFFGTNQSRTVIANIRIPEGYQFETLPKNTRITLEDKSLIVTRLVAAANGLLSTKITLEYKRPFYTIEEYPMLKEFYKKMYSLLDEQFVIKKKA